jgi:hypothetical protein
LKATVSVSPRLLAAERFSLDDEGDDVRLEVIALANILTNPAGVEFREILTEGA